MGGGGLPGKIGFISEGDWGGFSFGSWFFVEASPPIGLMVERFNKMGIDIRSFKEPLETSVRDVLVPSIRTNFEVGGRPKWRALEPTTLERRGGSTDADTYGAGASPLIATGKLMRAATAFARWGYTRETAFFSNLPVMYGIYHQYGFVNAQTENWVAARPFLVIQPQDEEKIEKVFIEWLERRIVSQV